MPTKNSQTETAAFDAVAASREWKQTVAETTAGMTMAERMAWFRSQSSIPAIRSRAKVPRRLKAHT
ncbi:MAG TPA: hypothetical protein DIT13_07325 [Verrucomicrobiales bacterium]|nr:hypothetical protein [Verrucomicrobiales bacterium]HRJ09026.1 hypothetical protein [Prosthecobacter sp.]HRK15544.1 hypothetical protein [Prosthecobacter sp.]